MMKPDIFLTGPDVGNLEKEYVLDALNNGWYKDKYKYIEKFEEVFARYHGRKYALMTCNCTSAIHLILAALDIGPGDEVLMPDSTWISTSLSTVHLGAKPIFCDVNFNDWCISTESIDINISPKTKAIIAVDLYGNTPNWDKLKYYSETYKIPIIEDAAEALGVSCNNKKVGSFGVASTFSFHNTKTITCGEGGILLLDDENLYKKCVKFRDVGRGPDTKIFFNDIVGYKFIPSNIQAALILAQFERLDEILTIRRKQHSYYKERLGNNYILNNDGAWCTVLLDKRVMMPKLRNFANKLEFSTRPFFFPLSMLPAYKEFNTYKSKNKVAYNLHERGLIIPGATNLTEGQLDFICTNILENTNAK